MLDSTAGVGLQDAARLPAAGTAGHRWLPRRAAAAIMPPPAVPGVPPQVGLVLDVVLVTLIAPVARPGRKATHAGARLLPPDCAAARLRAAAAAGP